MTEPQEAVHRRRAMPRRPSRASLADPSRDHQIEEEPLDMNPHASEAGPLLRDRGQGSKVEAVKSLLPSKAILVRQVSPRIPAQSRTL